MVDVVGVSLAIPGLVVLTAQAYISVKELIEGYRNLDRDMDKILLGITQAENMFMLQIRTLLEQVLDRDDVMYLLQQSRDNLHGDEDPALEHIRDRIHEALDPTFVSVLQGHIEKVREILKNIQCTLGDTLAQRQLEDTIRPPVHTGNRISSLILSLESVSKSLHWNFRIF
jgi:hypothetical protein